jgi:plastocyanin
VAWEATHEVAGPVFSATDDALVTLNNALLNELDTLNVMPGDTVRKGQKTAHNVVRAAKQFVGQGDY